ncbi:glycosyltransferase family 39 protein [Xanthobacter sp. KR7-225]|uniref:glycosyltransferase family 39 protein n=1 Tax=Xanthobacter sp. KR7-225 TaxID=3156613 RepID=UPI0032B318A8
MTHIDPFDLRRVDVPAGAVPVGAVPWWARPQGVVTIVLVWALVHILIATLLEVAVNADDAIESYMVQSLELSYVPRNPPFFDWLLYGLQQVVGTGLLSFALLRYALLAGCALLVWRVARQVIEDPRMQALAVYSLTAIWVIGYHSHRILTHSNVMIVAIAGTFLTLTAIARRPSLALYAGLGAWIAVGILGKFGFVAFLAALVLAGLLEPSYRRALMDRRLLVTLLTAAVPLGIYGAALYLGRQNVAAAAAQTIGATNAGWDEVLNSFLAALAGYALPLVALVAVVFLPYNRGEGARRTDAERGPPRRVLRTLMAVGVVATLVFVAAAGTEALRDRYFHVFLLLLPVYLFAELERLGGWRDRVVIFLALLLAMNVAIAAVRAVVPLWPDPRLCGRCMAAEPIYKIQAAVDARLGASPTLVADDRTSAGRLRAALPGARVVIVNERQYRPPPRPATGCARVTGIVNGLPILLPRPKSNTIEMSMKWWSPWMNPHRWSDVQLTPLAPDDPLCR